MTTDLPMPVTQRGYRTQDACELAQEVAETFSVYEMPWLALQRPFGQEPANEPLAASRELGR
jgi:hypothetical protein